MPYLVVALFPARDCPAVFFGLVSFANLDLVREGKRKVISAQGPGKVHPQFIAFWLEIRFDRVQSRVRCQATVDFSFSQMSPAPANYRIGICEATLSWIGPYNESCLGIRKI